MVMLDKNIQFAIKTHDKVWAFIDKEGELGFLDKRELKQYPKIKTKITYEELKAFMKDNDHYDIFATGLEDKKEYKELFKKAMTNPDIFDKCYQIYDFNVRYEFNHSRSITDLYSDARPSKIKLMLISEHVEKYIIPDKVDKFHKIVLDYYKKDFNTLLDAIKIIVDVNLGKSDRKINKEYRREGKDKVFSTEAKYLAAQIGEGCLDYAFRNTKGNDPDFYKFVDIQKKFENSQKYDNDSVNECYNFLLKDKYGFDEILTLNDTELRQEIYEILSEYKPLSAEEKNVDKLIEKIHEGYSYKSENIFKEIPKAGIIRNAFLTKQINERYDHLIETKDGHLYTVDKNGSLERQKSYKVNDKCFYDVYGIDLMHFDMSDKTLEKCAKSESFIKILADIKIFSPIERQSITSAIESGNYRKVEDELVNAIEMHNNNNSEKIDFNTVENIKDALQDTMDDRVGRRNLDKQMIMTEFRSFIDADGVFMYKDKQSVVQAVLDRDLPLKTTTPEQLIGKYYDTVSRHSDNPIKELYTCTPERKPFLDSQIANEYKMILKTTDGNFFSINNDNVIKQEDRKSFVNKNMLSARIEFNNGEKSLIVREEPVSSEFIKENFNDETFAKILPYVLDCKFGVEEELLKKIDNKDYKGVFDYVTKSCFSTNDKEFKSIEKVLNDKFGFERPPVFDPIEYLRDGIGD